MSATISYNASLFRLPQARLTTSRASRFLAHRMRKVFAAFALSLFSLSGALAGGEEPDSLVATREAGSNFARGEKEFQNVTGAFFYFDTGPKNRAA